MATKQHLVIDPLARLEGDVRADVFVEDGHVVDVQVEAVMFRGFEIILRGKDPLAGLIVTPRVCGICGGSHLYKACQAIDTAWRTEVPPNAWHIRNIAQACETLQSVPRWYYAIFAIDFVNKNYAKSKLYDEVVKRWAPFVGTSYKIGLEISALPVKVYAMFGGQWPHSSFMVPGGVMCAPQLDHITRAYALLERYRTEWLEKVWLGCSVDRWLENKTWDDILKWLDESESHRNSDCGLFLRFCMENGLDKYGAGVNAFLAYGTYIDPEFYPVSTIEGRNQALQSPSGVVYNGKYYVFDQMNVREDVTHSYFEGSSLLHPWEGETVPLDPEVAKRQGKYSWAKSPRYLIDGKPVPLEAGPLARQVVAGYEEAKSACSAAGCIEHAIDPLFKNIVSKIGPSVMVRVLARMHEAVKYYKWVKEWLAKVDFKDDRFYKKPKELPEGKGFGATEAARGALADWIVIENGKIKNYQIITPTAWNIGPKDSKGQMGPIEKAIVGAPIKNPEDPIEVAHVARSFDSCLVCTVHVYDRKRGEELARYKLGTFK
ncbi:nickel-dependent hydrogenase large subunit [Hydrogenobacter hydrogenophilus]|uniref:[NiFe]-hydrogenase II apoprotein, large subunit n=1 Tax=Hydrogenobacter hydrogenophilus TaxID=35835 RepID=A0A285P4E7_9AQUI|nr:nickel-dependent hydrogenase large subunit [Hydrogenobacter hydrogenophilus]SNZ16600.1 [NiFe]-hydrogenase II apoprotein, large subunit [Hydrogenobacter hydrogenophilus]